MPHPPSRRQLLLATATACLLGPAGTASAQGAAPLKLVITFPPGGSTDIAARILQPRLGEVAGRSVIVENRPGAASQIATQYVAKSAPDGNTLLFSFDTHAINPIAKSRLPYDTFKDFTGVSLALRFPLVIGASASVPAKDLAGFLELARRNPGKYSYASTGLGSMNHLVMEDIKRRSGTYVLHVPYGGGGPAVQAVLGNVSDLTLLSYAALRGQISAGKIKPLAVTGLKRLPELPDVPTVAEAGVPGYEATSWFGLWTQAKTPAAVQQRLYKAIAKVLKDPAVVKKINDQGGDVVIDTPAEFLTYIKAESAKWNKVVKDSGAQV